MSEVDFLAHFDVSRETLERLRIYAALLEKWNPAINLVAPSTLPNLWSRHFVDSAQVADLAPKEIENWCDIGTGGGFPGVVIAILAKEFHPKLKVGCIESDVRKAAFLRSVARETDANIQVCTQRIEQADPQNANVLSARALARLPKLLSYTERHLAKGGHALLLKGQNYQAEVQEALENWRFDLDTYPSKTNPDAVILKIGDLSRA